MDEKHELLGNFEKTFEKCQNFSEENCEKSMLSANFLKSLTRHELHFWLLDEKCKLLGNFEKTVEDFQQIS